MADPPQDPAPRRQPYEPKDGDVSDPYWGLVTDLTKTSITIQFDCQKDRKPNTFLVSETLVAGLIPKEPRPRPGTNHKYVVPATHMYRLTDVKVGDWVAIYYARLGDADVCDHICIQKRPGGRVPPLPEEAEALRKDKIHYDEWINAYWDLEDKGIPYPEKFGIRRRFPVAPMPREVKPLVPLIGP
jgi:hypothetical protein